MRKKKMKVLIILLVVLAILIITVLIVFPPSRGKITPLLDENGTIFKGSIAEKSFVLVDGCDIGLITLTEDINNPVLLVCGGGPGIPQYLLEYMYPTNLYKIFTVCYFDYRGTGLSYDKRINASDMTTARYLDDVQAITDYLRERFAKEKIYIMGHSFGTYIALNTIKNHPEKYEAYFAMSQITDQVESEYMGYDYMRAQYEQMDNASMVRKFDNCPIRESDEIFNRYFASSLRDSAMHDLGVGTTRDMDSVISGIFFPSLRCRAYTWKERINLWKGKAQSGKFLVVNDSLHFNAWEEVASVDIPIYFLAGVYDYTCNYELQKKYYEYISAPVKEFFVFENSAHSPAYEEPDKAAEILGAIASKRR